MALLQVLENYVLAILEKKIRMATGAPHSCFVDIWGKAAPRG